jgi:hypothetical protein
MMLKLGLLFTSEASLFESEIEMKRHKIISIIEIEIQLK